MVKLPEPVTYQFEHATVMWRREVSAALGQEMPRLYVQCVDQYGYQRELTVQRREVDSRVYWESHAYRHPGRRHICEVSEAVAARFIARFLEQCEKYPSLLFNKAGDHTSNIHRPRAEGFVHMTESLLDGTALSVRLL